LKKILLLIPLIGLTYSGYGQYSWIQKASLPAPERYAATSCVSDDRVFIGLGSNGSTIFKDWWEYDPINDSWTQKADFIPGGRYVAASMSINGTIYLGLGVDFLLTIRHDWWSYDPIMNSWMQKNNFPSVERYGVSTFVIDGMGYICFGNEGGGFGPYTNELWQYDPSTDSWQIKTPAPTVARYGTLGLAINGKGYAGLGGIKQEDGSYLFHKDFYEYDPQSDSWSKKANYPRRESYPVSFVLDGHAYVGLGNANPIIDPNIYVYDPAIDQWNPSSHFPGGGRFVAIGFSVNGNGYVGLGASSLLADFQNDLWEFTPPEKISASSDSSNIGFLPGINQLIPHFTGDAPHLLVVYNLTGVALQSELVNSDDPINLNQQLADGVCFATLFNSDGSIACTRKIVLQQ